MVQDRMTPPCERPDEDSSVGRDVHANVVVGQMTDQAAPEDQRGDRQIQRECGEPESIRESRRRRRGAAYFLTASLRGCHRHLLMARRTRFPVAWRGRFLELRHLEMVRDVGE